MQLKKIATLGVICFLASGCTPPWSIKLPPPTGPEVKHVQVVDQRSSDERQFQFVDFAKVSYKSYLGDTNTTPDRIAFLRSKVNEQAALVPDGATVVVHHFQVLQDLSGSACKGCALAAVSYPAAVAADAGRKPGDDSFTCSISASLNGTEFSAEASAFFKMGPFDSIRSEHVAVALGKCMSDAVGTWLSKAGAPSN